MIARAPSPAPVRTVRCAIYTRKSTEEGLDQDFNSLDAQREAAESYVASQRHEGWVALADRYDDGGFSGGTLDRPGLGRLLADVERGRVDTVVVYKVDRLSRSLLDFARIVEILERSQVTFVSVTQQFNTTTSMGRLTLNILLSFAQFEREIIGERIRDKIAAAKRKGKHTGGMPVLGYDTDLAEKRLVVNEEEAELVRHVFDRFRQLGSGTRLCEELNAAGHSTKRWVTRKGSVEGGRPWNKGHLYRLLGNRKYVGEIEHRGTVYPGEQDAIVPRALWDDVHRILAENHAARANRTRARTPALLKGLLRCAHCGGSMGATWTRSHGKTYRYYLCVKAVKGEPGTCPVRSVPAGALEEAVLEQLRAVFRSPEIVARTFREAKALEAKELERLHERKADLEERVRERDGREDDPAATADAARDLEAVAAELRALDANLLSETEVIAALRRIDPLWEELFPAEQARVVRLLVERVEVSAEGLEVRLRAAGLHSLVAELGAPRPEEVSR